MHFGTLNSAILHSFFIGWVLYVGFAAPKDSIVLNFSEIALISEEELKRLLPQSQNTPVIAPSDPPAPEAIPKETAAEAAPETAPETAPEAIPENIPEEGLKELPSIPNAPPTQIGKENSAPYPVSSPIAENLFKDKDAQKAPKQIAQSRPQPPPIYASPNLPQQTIGARADRDDNRAAPKPFAENNTAFNTAFSGAESPTSLAPAALNKIKSNIRRAIAPCWNIGALSSDARNIVITVFLSLDFSGRPERGTIRLIAWQGGNERAAKKAFGVARRAIIRCGQSGFNMPSNKYSQWRNLELVFDPIKIHAER